MASGGTACMLDRGVIGAHINGVSLCVFIYSPIGLTEITFNKVGISEFQF